MSLKDKIKALAKSPFFWIVVAIGIIGIAILVVSIKPGKDNCPPGTSRGQCGDKCVPTCPSGKYDCSTNKCVCPDGQKMCNAECCPADGCINGLCCSSKRQCPIGPGGEMQCCSNGQICDLTSKKCVSTCAVNGKECKINETCLTVGQKLTQALRDKFMKDFPLDKYPSALCVNEADGYTCSVCVPESTCQFDDNQPSPAALKEKDSSNYYPCTNIINGTDDAGVVGYCSSDKSPSYASRCNAYSKDSDCEKNENCTWRNIFDTSVTNDVINQDIANIGSQDPTKTEYEGNWCGSIGKYLQVNKMKQTQGSTACDVTTCWDVLNKHKNVIDIHWDEEGKVCTSVASCDTGTPEGFSSPCTDAVPPSICSNDGYTCATSGEITKPIPDACTTRKTCSTVAAAVMSGDEPDIGWCINETSPGNYEQSCELSESACNEQGPGAIFVNSPWMCPYEPKNEVGCGPNNYLSKSGETFTCTPDNPSNRLEGLGNVCASGYESSVRTFVYNRTMWPITLSYVDGTYSCSYGMVCSPSSKTIKPYSFASYDAGASPGDFFDPQCTSYATFENFGSNNSFSIYLNLHDRDNLEFVVTAPPIKTSGCAESVYATWKTWSDWDKYIAYIIFFPSWQMTIPDSTITWDVD